MSDGLVDMRRWLVERKRWDRLRELRPWSVDRFDVKVGESRERPHQLQLERDFDGHDGHGRRALGYGDDRT